MIYLTFFENFNWQCHTWKYLCFGGVFTNIDNEQNKVLAHRASKFGSHRPRGKNMKFDCLTGPA